MVALWATVAESPTLPVTKIAQVMKAVGKSSAAYVERRVLSSGCRVTLRAILILLATTATAHADDAPGIAGLLANPADLARWLHDHDPQTLAAKDKVEAASEAAEQARVFPNPQASGALANVAVAGPNAAPGTPRGPTALNQTTNISFGITELFEIGKRGPRRQAADLRTQEATEAGVGALGGRMNDALNTLGKLAYVVARRDVVSQNLDAARKLQANEQIRVEQHDLAGIDFARIELETEALEIELGRSDADVAISLAACAATLFAPCSPSGLDAATLDAAAPIPDALPDVSKSIEDRPVHQAQKLEGQALEEDARLAEARRIPDPTFGITYTYDNYTFGGGLPQTLAVSIGIPLPLFDRGQHDAAAARANARALQQQELAVIRGERGGVDGLVSQLEKLKVVLHRLETDSVPKAQKIVEQTRKAFDLGQSGLADLLLAERQYRDLLLQLLDTRFDLFTVRVQLRQAIGIDDGAARSAGGVR
jgi:cobalt-zinc-cadmium efflux system outer membrane protein